MKKVLLYFLLIFVTFGSKASEITIKDSELKLKLTGSVVFTSAIKLNDDNLFEITTEAPRLNGDSFSIGRMSAGPFSSVDIDAFKSKLGIFDIYLAKQGGGFTLNSSLELSLFYLNLPSSDLSGFESQWKTGKPYGQTVLLGIKTEDLSYNASFSQKSGFNGKLELDLNIGNISLKRVFSSDSETNISVSFTETVTTKVTYKLLISQKPVYGGSARYKLSSITKNFSYKDFSLETVSQVEAQEDTGVFYTTNISLSYKNFTLSTVLPRTSGIEYKLSNIKLIYNDDIVSFSLGKKPSMTMNLDFNFLQISLSSEVHNIVTWKFRF